MRIRNAAIAGATALAVAFGGTTVATAQAEQPDFSAPNQPTNDPDKKDGGTLSSKIGAQLGAGEAANGQAIFGSSKTENDGEDTFAGQPAWAKVLYALTIVGGLGAVVGGVIGPVYNFIVHGPLSN